MEVRWAVIPAAGRGARMAGVTGGLPKEMLPVGGAPLILHKIRGHLAAGNPAGYEAARKLRQR